MFNLFFSFSLSFSPYLSHPLVPFLFYLSGTYTYSLFLSLTLSYSYVLSFFTFSYILLSLSLSPIRSLPFFLWNICLKMLALCIYNAMQTSFQRLDSKIKNILKQESTNYSYFGIWLPSTSIVRIWFFSLFSQNDHNFYAHKVCMKKAKSKWTRKEAIFKKNR